MPKNILYSTVRHSSSHVRCVIGSLGLDLLFLLVYKFFFFHDLIFIFLYTVQSEMCVYCDHRIQSVCSAPIILLILQKRKSFHISQTNVN